MHGHRNSFSGSIFRKWWTARPEILRTRPEILRNSVGVHLGEKRLGIVADRGLRVERFDLCRLNHWLRLRCRREVGSADCLLRGHRGRCDLLDRLLADNSPVDRSFLALADQLLCLRAVVLDSAAAGLNCLACVLTGEIADLSGLLGNDGRGIVEVLIYEFLVADVRERGEVDDGGEEQKQSPLGHDLDEEIGDEGRDKSLLCKVSVR